VKVEDRHRDNLGHEALRYGWLCVCVSVCVWSQNT